MALLLITFTIYPVENAPEWFPKNCLPLLITTVTVVFINADSNLIGLAPYGSLLLVVMLFFFNLLLSRGKPLPQLYFIDRCNRLLFGRCCFGAKERNRHRLPNGTQVYLLSGTTSNFTIYVPFPLHSLSVLRFLHTGTYFRWQKDTN